MDLNKIPADYVEQYAEMDPQTEDLLPTGRYLNNGMIVLIESRIMRNDIADLESKSGYYKDRARENNRWCMVTEVHNRGDITSFVAVYADGTKRVRRLNQSYAWYVKIDSVQELVLDDEDDKPTCDHPIGTHYPHCTTVGCPNYAGLFAR